jgi:hypothetical protein
LSPEVVAVE